LVFQAQAYPIPSTNPIKKELATKIPAQEQQPLYTSDTEKPKSNVWIWVIFGLFCFIVGAIIF
jgi:hypothetical protein